MPDDVRDDETMGDCCWLCWCGHFEESMFHCSACGAEPPWGCPGECCQGGEDDDCGEIDYDPYEEAEYGGEG